MDNDGNYGAWEQTVPQTIKGDTLWKLKAYRMGLYIADISLG